MYECQHYDVANFSLNKEWPMIWFYQNAKKTAILQISIIYALRLVLVSQMTSTLFFIQKKIKKFNMYFCKLTFSEFNIFPKNYCCHNSWQRDNYIGKITIFKWYKKSFHILMVAIIFLPTISLNTSYISNSYRRNLLI